MNKYIYILLALILWSCENKEHIEYYPNGNIKLIATKENDVFDGTVKGYYEDGSIRYIEEWSNGNIDGVVKFFYKNGVLQEETEWDDNERDGISKRFYRDGKILSIAKYRNDQKKEVKFFYKNKQLNERQLYNEDGDMIYLTRLDSLGNKTLESLIPLFAPDNDTINLNAVHKFIVYFGLPLKGDVKVYTGEYEEGSPELVNLVQLEEIEPYVFQYIYRPKKTGSYSIPFKFEHDTDESDTLNVNGLSVKHGIHVIDDSAGV